jgi:TetR/AcrR family tetracycline transcriptional repressor
MEPAADKATTLPSAVPRLERDKVVHTALELLDEVGFDGLTLRRLADRLSVKAAALYWHFRNKQDLIDQMAFAVLCGEHPERKGVDNWRELLAILGRTHRQALLAHRDGARLIASADLARLPLLDGLELMLQKLRSNGFSNELALLSIVNITRFTLGCVFEEQTYPRPGEEGLEIRKNILQNAADRYPVSADTFLEVAKKHALTPERQFEHGLELLLAGIEQKLAKA